MDRVLPIHIAEAFATGGTVGINGKHVHTPDQYWREVDLNDSASIVPEPLVNPQPSEDLTKVTGERDTALAKVRELETSLASEKSAHATTKTDLTKVTGERDTAKASVSTAETLLKNEKSSHTTTKANLATVTSERDANSAAVTAAGDLLKKLIPAKEEDFDQLSAANKKAIAKTFGLQEGATSADIIKAVHGG